jgi:hypothetical protein
MFDGNIGDRVSAVERIIPRPPDDVAPMRTAFARMVSKQWQIYVPPTLAGCGDGMAGSQFGKGRFIGEMYARACYSMLLVSQRGPSLLRALVRAASLLPPSRGLTIGLGSALLGGMAHLLPKAVHRQLLLTSALIADPVFGPYGKPRPGGYNKPLQAAPAGNGEPCRASSAQAIQQHKRFINDLRARL